MELSFKVRPAKNGYIVMVDGAEHVATSQKDIGELIKGLLRGKFTERAEKPDA
jgi:hypothetical protein